MHSSDRYSTISCWELSEGASTCSCVCQHHGKIQTSRWCSCFIRERIHIVFSWVKQTLPGKYYTSDYWRCWKCLSRHHPLVSALPAWQLMWICQTGTLQYKDITTSVFHALVLCWWCGNTQTICKLVEQLHCVHYILVDAARHLCRWTICHVYAEQLACWDLIRSLLLDVQHESKVFQFYLLKAPASPSCELLLCQGNPEYWSA